MTTEGKRIDMAQGMDMSGLPMAGMPGMTAPTVDADSIAARVPQIARYVRYSGWPELKEAMVAGKVKAAMMLAPMVMDLAAKGVPVKVVALGHRSGAVIMVRRESPYKSFADLKGKRIAIPSRFAVDHIFVRKLMAAHGLKDGDLTMVELAPPDMPAALLADAVDAYATGEPFGAKAEMDGYARVLYMTRDVWPTYICCVLAVRQELIDPHRETVQLLVDPALAAGRWAETRPEDRTRAGHIASHPGGGAPGHCESGERRHPAAACDGVALPRHLRIRDRAAARAAVGNPDGLVPHCLHGAQPRGADAAPHLPHRLDPAGDPVVRSRRPLADGPGLSRIVL